MVLSSIIGIVACKKLFLNPEDKSANATELSISEVKAHFKSIDKELAAVHSDIADPNNFDLLWSKAMQVSRRGENFVEVPVSVKRKKVVLYGISTDSLNKAQCELVSNFVVQRILFFRDKNGEIQERILTYVPEMAYAIRRKSEIHLNSIKKLQSNFSGFIEYKTVDNKVTKILQIKSGKIVKIARPAVNNTTGKTNAGGAARTTACYQLCSPIYDEECTTTMEEDIPVITCRTVKVGETCIYWCDDPEDPDPDPDPDPEPDPDPNPDCSDPSYITETTSAPHDYYLVGNTVYAKVTHYFSNSCNNQTWQTVTDEYQQQETEDYQDGVNAVSNGEKNYLVTANIPSTEFTEAGVQKRNASPRWHFYTANFYHRLVKLEYSAFFSAVHFKTGSTWKFESLKYLNTALTSGSMPACQNLVVTVNTSTINIATDKLTANVTLNYTAANYISCLWNTNTGTDTDNITRTFTTNDGVQ
jgi:hypothetical protein